MGGAERLIAEIAPLMKRKKMDIDVLILKNTDTPFKKALQEKGVNVFYVKNTSLYSPFQIFKIKSYLKKYDIVHVHLFPAQYWVAFANMISIKNPILITTEHSTSNRRRSISLFKFIDRFIYSYYNRIIGISDAVTANISNYICKDSKCITIENGVDTNKYYRSSPLDRKSIDYTEQDFLLVMVASFREAKDQDTLIKSLLNLPNNVKAVLVGDGPRRTECQLLCDNLKLNNRVTFLGIRNDIPEIFKMSDVAVVSSHWEGFGLVAVEGMAAGKPLVASNVSGLAEVVGGFGLLFEQGNAQELAEKIRSLMINKDYYDKVARMCYNRSLDFDITKMVDKTISLYKKVFN